MKQKQIEENLGPMKLIFNYEDVFYSFFYDDISGCIHVTTISPCIKRRRTGKGIVASS